MRGSLLLVQRWDPSPSPAGPPGLRWGPPALLGHPWHCVLPQAQPPCLGSPRASPEPTHGLSNPCQSRAGMGVRKIFWTWHWTGFWFILSKKLFQVVKMAKVSYNWESRVGCVGAARAWGRRWHEPAHTVSVEIYFALKRKPKLSNRSRSWVGWLDGWFGWLVGWFVSA